MTPITPTPFESRLAEALRQEAESAMTMTNTPQELERFQESTIRVRRRQRLIAVAAAVAILGAGAAIAVALLSSGSSRHTVPSKHPTTNHPVPHSSFAPPSALPATTPVTKLPGPLNFGAVAFGSLWVTSGDLGHGTLYRVTPDGGRILSTTPFPGVNGFGSMLPARIGHTIVAADGADNRYTVFNSAGQKVGTLPMPGVNQAPASAAGDATGGWVTTTPHTIARVDASGMHITRTITVSARAEIDGLAEGPGTLWAIDGTSSKLLRIDARTGHVTGHLNFRTHLTSTVVEPNKPVAVQFIGSAVYVSNEDYGLRRIDPQTMKVTAVTYSHQGLAWPTPIASTNGQVWFQPGVGVMAQLDPTTLKTLRSIRVFSVKGDQSGGTFGGLVTPTRAYVSRPLAYKGGGNGRQGPTRGVLYSFPLK